MQSRYPTVTNFLERWILSLFDICTLALVGMTRNLSRVRSPHKDSILILAPFYLGDGISSTQVLKALRDHFQTYRITLVGPDSLVALWSSWNIADEFDMLTMESVYQAKRWGQILKQVKRWRGKRFCKTIILDADPLVNFIGYMCGAPGTIGFSYRGGGSFLTHKIGFDRPMYMGYERLLLLNTLGIHIADEPISFPESDQKAISSIKTLFQQHQLDNSRPLIGLFPGGRKKIKQWPWGNYISVVKSIRYKYPGAKFLLLGDKVNVEDQLVDQYSLIPMWSKFDLTVLIELIRSLDLVIGGDTGPLHIAYGTKTPSVTIFGPSDPERYFLPSKVNHAVIPECECRPVVRRPKNRSCRTTQIASCLKGVEPYIVTKKALELLKLG